MMPKCNPYIYFPTDLHKDYLTPDDSYSARYLSTCLISDSYLIVKGRGSGLKAKHVLKHLMALGSS